MTDIRAPEEQTEGTRSQVLRWLKAVGDDVAEHEPLIEIETDKVTVEVAAPASGVLREILKAEQEEIAPGDVLGRIETGGAALRTGDAVGAEGQTIGRSLERATSNGIARSSCREPSLYAESAATTRPCSSSAFCATDTVERPMV